MAKYRLRAGKKHFHEGAMVEAGTVIDLTDSQARAWKDKFELVSGTAPTEPPAPSAKTTAERIAELAKPAEQPEAKKG